jgi:fermentation-respiration switch protein FrsA (DUF1100 family)
MQGEDDQIVPYKGAALLQVKLLKNPTLKLYPGFPHGMLTTTPRRSTRTSWNSLRDEIEARGRHADRAGGNDQRGHSRVH